MHSNSAIMISAQKVITKFTLVSYKFMVENVSLCLYSSVIC